MGRQPLPTDTILGNGSDQYRIDTVLGPGGFGITYLARDLRFDRDVAVKEYFPADFAYREGSATIRSTSRGGKQNYFEQGKRHFIDEARTLARFRHEHIVRVINLFEQFNTAYMVLEFEEGESFKNWLRGLGRSPAQAELDAIVWPLLDALEVVHAKGMFHRDIAPDNIIIRPGGKPVLIDFGAARHFVREQSHTLGAIVKHGYSPPEQYTLDTKLQGAWSDIYSLSATVYAALMGQPPLEASSRQLRDTVLPVEQHLPSIQRGSYRPSFLAALDAGLALKPNERPQTIADFRSMLEAPPVASASPELPAVSQTNTRASLVEGGGRSTSHVPTVAAGTLKPSRSNFVSVRPQAAGDDPEAFSDTAAATPPSGRPAAYPETAARVAGATALGIATLAAISFLSLGGIEHPAGLAVSILVCLGLVAAGIERTVSLARAGAVDVGRSAVAAAVMLALALAVYWLPFFFWPVSVLLAAAAALFGAIRFGRWVPMTLLGLAVVHLCLAAALLFLATRSVQKDPYFLPIMGTSLAVLAGLVLTSALQIKRRWEPSAP